MDHFGNGAQAISGVERALWIVGAGLFAWVLLLALCYLSLRLI